MNWLKYLRALPRQLIALLAVILTLSQPAFADPGSRTAAGSHRTLSNLAYIRGDRAGLEATHPWTEKDVVIRKSCMELSGAAYQACAGGDPLDAIVAQTITDWQECNSRYGVSCRVMIGGTEDATTFKASDAGQTSARGGLIGGRIGYAMTALETKDTSVRHWLRPAFMLAKRGGTDSVDDRFVEMWILPPDVGADFAALGYKKAMSDMDAARMLEDLYSARNAPDVNMFISGYLLNLQTKKPQSWVKIPRFGMPSTGSFPMPDQCLIEMDQPYSRADVVAGVESGKMPGGSSVIATYVRERWSQIGHCPAWATKNTSQVIWDLSTNVCREAEHDDDGIITVDGIVELEIALRKEKEGQFDSEGFARHLVMLDGQDGFTVEGDLMRDGYLQVNFVGLCGIDVWNKKVQAEVARIEEEKRQEAARKALLLDIDDWYTRSARFSLAFDGLFGTDILLTDPNPYDASAAFVGGGMLKIGGSFGNDLHRLVPFAIAIPQWHGGTEFYANAPAGLGFGGGLAYQGGIRGDVGGSIGGGYYHSWSAWTDGNGSRWDDLDDTVFTELNLLVHPRGEFLGYVDGRSVYAGGARKGALVLGLHTAVSFRSGLEPGSMMTLAQIKGVVGFEY